MRIGKCYTEYTDAAVINCNDYNGQLDEFRIYDGELSADWHATEYSNQNNPSGFYSVGNQDTLEDVRYLKTQTRSRWW